MRTAFGNAVAFENDNSVSIAHGGKPVSDDDGCAALNELVKRFLDELFGFSIHRRSGFI